MAAGKLNYIVVYEGMSQVFGCASKKIALESAPPEGYSVDQKSVLFITYDPDGKALSVYKLPEEEVRSAELKTKKKNENE